jgi:hypothetical protein
MILYIFKHIGIFLATVVAVTVFSMFLICLGYCLALSFFGILAWCVDGIWTWKFNMNFLAPFFRFSIVLGIFSSILSECGWIEH